MWFIKELTRSIQLPPASLGTDIENYLVGTIHATIEGHFDSDLGAVIVLAPVVAPQSGYKFSISPGRVLDDGSCLFSVRFHAIILRPLQGEVADTVVTNVRITPNSTTASIALELGPLQGAVMVNRVYNPDDGPPPRRSHWRVQETDHGPALVWNSYDSTTQTWNQVSEKTIAVGRTLRVRVGRVALVGDHVEFTADFQGQHFGPHAMGRPSKFFGYS